jgi:SOS-response transcriptional repressor LexA
MSELTEKQTQVLDFIRDGITKRQRAPTMREIQKHIQANNIATVQAHLFFLMKKGKIKVSSGIHRGIELVNP